MQLSIVIPVLDEVQNVLPLAREIRATLREHQPFEIIFVDDGSTDGTSEAVESARREVPEIRLLRHAQRCGQSAALRTGVLAARAVWVASLDGDCQNDPADIPAMLAALQGDDRVRLVIGNRKVRRDSWVRRISSRLANSVRRHMLQDGTPDTGCGIKLMHRDTFIQLQFFDHMHRFLPALFQAAGWRVISVPVHHRPRAAGRSKYGINNRLWVGIIDLFGVRWLTRRTMRPTQVVER